MWLHILNEGQDLQWVVDTLTNGKRIRVTDGSDNPKVAPTVSGAGWILYRTAKQCKLYALSFSALLGPAPTVSRYRAGILL